MQLIDSTTKKPVNVGDIVTTFRGEKMVVTGMIEPRHAGSTGRVILDGQAYYPSVINAEWSK